MAIIHRGTLTIEKLKELCLEHLEIKSDSDMYNPAKGEGIISLRKQEDGNWKGTMLRNGTLLESREQDPQYALQALMTHI